jgi:hypothetical protein
LEVGYGKTNALIERTPLQTWFHRFLPGTGANLLGFKADPPKTISTAVSANAELVFWIRRTAPPKEVVLPPETPDSWRQEWSTSTKVFASDEYGNEYQNQPGFPQGALATDHLIPIEITAFPRNGKVVALKILRRPGPDSQAWKQVAEFRTANPTQGTRQYWNPNPPQDKQKVGQLEFSIADLRVVTSTRGPERLRSGESLAVARFLIDENGKANWDWNPINAWIYEANGNFRGPLEVTPYVRTFGTPALYSPDESVIAGALNPDEPWKFHVQFRHTRRSDTRFDPNDIWVDFMVQPAMANGAK